MERSLGTWSLGSHAGPPSPLFPRQALGCLPSVPGPVGLPCFLLPTLALRPLPLSAWPSNQVASVKGRNSHSVASFCPWQWTWCRCKEGQRQGHALCCLRVATPLHVWQLTQRGPSWTSPVQALSVYWHGGFSPLGVAHSCGLGHWFQGPAFLFCTGPCKLWIYPSLRILVKATTAELSNRGICHCFRSFLFSFQHLFT